MSRGVPDRTPFMCQLSIGHMLLALSVSPAEFWHDATTFAEGLVWLRDLYDFDGVLVSLHGHDPDRINEVQAIRRTAGGEEVTFRDGSMLFCPQDDLPRVFAARPEPRVRLGALDTRVLPPTLAYIPVTQGLRFPITPEHEFDVFRILRRRLGRRYSLHGEVTSPLDYYLDLVGLEEGLIGLVEHPDAAHTILAHFAALVAGLASRMCGEGVDAIKISSPYAGRGFLSLPFYRSFVVPYERVVARAIESRGVRAYLHTCGAVGDRLELMFESGVSGIECLDPPPLGDVELHDARRRTKQKGFIKGNVDSVNLLLNGDGEAIRKDARERLGIGKEGGGYIFSTACSVAPHVPRTNLLLLREAVERWG